MASIMKCCSYMADAALIISMYVLIQIRLSQNVGETYLSGVQNGLEIAITRWFQC